MKFNVYRRVTGQMEGCFLCEAGEQRLAFLEWCNSFRLRCVDYRFEPSNLDSSSAAQSGRHVTSQTKKLYVCMDAHNAWDTGGHLLIWIPELEEWVSSNRLNADENGWYLKVTY